MSIFDKIKAFSYGGIFGLISSKLLYKGIKYKNLAKIAHKNNDYKKEEFYNNKSKLMKILAGGVFVSSLSAYLLDIGKTPFNYLISGSSFGEIYGLYTLITRDDV